MKKNLSKKPSNLINGLLVILFRPLFKYYFNFKFDRSAIEGLKGPAVFLSNHSSAIDVFLMGLSAHPIAINYVAGYEWFQKPIIKFLLKKLNAVPKFQYQLDVESIRAMFKVVEEGNILGLFPTGRLSADGSSIDVNQSVAKLLKKLDVPVYFFKINGAYMSLPKWAKHSRRGLVSGSYKLLFNTDQLKAQTIDDMTEMINDHLSYNEYQWAFENNIEFKGRRLASGLENILFLCPQCKTEFNLNTKGNLIYCTCGLKTQINTKGQFSDGFLFNNPHAWYNFQKEHIKNLIKTSKLKIIDEAQLSYSTLKTRNKQQIGKGLLTIIDHKIIFKYLNNNKSNELVFDLVGIPSLPFKSGSNFEIAVENKIYTFNLENGKSAAKWSLIVEGLNEVKRINGN
jgi:hypothetical protein